MKKLDWIMIAAAVGFLGLFLLGPKSDETPVAIEAPVVEEPVEEPAEPAPDKNRDTNTIIRDKLNAPSFN